MTPDAQTRFEPRHPLDLPLTLSPLGLGSWLRRDNGDVWRATRTPEGPATIHITRDNGALLVEGWGQGATWAVSHSPSLCGEQDDDSGFVPTHPLIADLYRRHPGLRLPRTHAVFEALVPAVLAQLVTSEEARSSYRAVRWAEFEPYVALVDGDRSSTTTNGSPAYAVRSRSSSSAVDVLPDGRA